MRRKPRLHLTQFSLRRERDTQDGVDKSIRGKSRLHLTQLSLRRERETHNRDDAKLRSNRRQTAHLTLGQHKRRGMYVGEYYKRSRGQKTKVPSEVDPYVHGLQYMHSKRFSRKLTLPTSRMSRKRSSALRGCWADTHVFIAIAVHTCFHVHAVVRLAPQQ